MNNLTKRIAFLACLTAAVLCVFSCNKDEDEDTDSMEFTGSLAFDLPQFMLQNEVHIIQPTGLSRDTTDTSSRKDYGIAVTQSNLDYTDTIRREGSEEPAYYKVVTPAPDTLGAFSVTAYAFASGYSSAYYEVDCYIVAPGINQGSIMDWPCKETDPTFKDPYDGTSYYITSNTTGPVLMRHNYCGSDLGNSFAGCSAMQYVFGKYYTWNEAMKACPAGWHLPSQSEFMEFCSMYAGLPDGFKLDDTYLGIAGNLMADATFNAEKLWEYWPAVNITNSSGFAALSTGYATIKDNGRYTFDGAQEYFCFWTSDEEGDSGVYRYINAQYNNVYRGTADKDHFALPIRCCKDK